MPVRVDEALKTKGVPVDDNIQVLFPASRIVAAPSPDLPMFRAEETVIVPEPPVWVVMVGVLADLPKVRVTNFQLVEPEVVPKSLDAPTLCSKVPAVVRLMVPAPVTDPAAKIVPLAVPDKVPVTVISPVWVQVPVPVVKVAPAAMVVVPVTVRVGLFVAAVAPWLVPSPTVRLLVMVKVWLAAVQTVCLVDPPGFIPRLE